MSLTPMTLTMITLQPLYSLEELMCNCTNSTWFPISSTALILTQMNSEADSKSRRELIVVNWLRRAQEVVRLLLIMFRIKLPIQQAQTGVREIIRLWTFLCRGHLDFCDCPCSIWFFDFGHGMLSGAAKERQLT